MNNVSSLIKGGDEDIFLAPNTKKLINEKINGRLQSISEQRQIQSPPHESWWIGLITKAFLI
jgi:hypothetical protein